MILSHLSVTQNKSLKSIKVNNSSEIVVLSDFNAKSSFWYNNDILHYECSKVYDVTSQFGLQQIIKEPTHITIMYRPDFYNLIKFNYMESGVHSSLHANCHRHITFRNLILKYIISLLINGKSGIIKKLILTDHIR